MSAVGSMPGQVQCTIEHRTPGAPDDYGDPVPTVTSTTAARALLWESSTLEDNAMGVTVGESWRIVLPPATPVGPHDAVVVNGQRFEVDGMPWLLDRQETGGVASHVELKLKRAS